MNKKILRITSKLLVPTNNGQPTPPKGAILSVKQFIALGYSYKENIPSAWEYYDEMKVGDILPEDKLKTFTFKENTKRYLTKKENFWKRNEAFFKGDRKVEEITNINDKDAFFVSGTISVYLQKRRWIEHCFPEEFPEILNGDIVKVSYNKNPASKKYNGKVGKVISMGDKESTARPYKVEFEDENSHYYEREEIELVKREEKLTETLTKTLTKTSKIDEQRELKIGDYVILIDTESTSIDNRELGRVGIVYGIDKRDCITITIGKRKWSCVRKQLKYTEIEIGDEIEIVDGGVKKSPNAVKIGTKFIVAKINKSFDDKIACYPEKGDGDWKCNCKLIKKGEKKQEIEKEDVNKEEKKISPIPYNKASKSTDEEKSLALAAKLYPPGTKVDRDNIFPDISQNSKIFVVGNPADYALLKGNVMVNGEDPRKGKYIIRCNGKWAKIIKEKEEKKSLRSAEQLIE